MCVELTVKSNIFWPQWRPNRPAAAHRRYEVGGEALQSRVFAPLRTPKKARLSDRIVFNFGLTGWAEVHKV